MPQPSNVAGNFGQPVGSGTSGRRWAAWLTCQAVGSACWLGRSVGQTEVLLMGRPHQKKRNCNRCQPPSPTRSKRRPLCRPRPEHASQIGGTTLRKVVCWKCGLAFHERESSPDILGRKTPAVAPGRAWS